MTYDRELLRLWAQPEGILEPHEQHRVSDFLDLFALMLEAEKCGPQPTVVDCFVARRSAKIVWDFDRQTNQKAGAALPNRYLAMSSEFEDNQVRHRLNQLALEELDSARMFGRVAKGAIEINVVAFNPARRKTG